MGVDDNHCEVAYHSAKRSGVKGTEAHRRQWDCLGYHIKCNT